MITSAAPMQASFLPYGVRVHQGVETKVVFGGQTMVHAKTRVQEKTRVHEETTANANSPADDSAPPIAIDYLHLAGRAKGSISLGLLRWDGDIAVFCTAPAGAPRPSQFDSPPGSGVIFSRWKRKT
ncbi:MAG: hypothetical protein JNK48_25150 [Bryobacterales bacterium]|nr:hypothetical protein [Bryobacterales bacterium]